MGPESSGGYRPSPTGFQPRLSLTDGAVLLSTWLSHLHHPIWLSKPLTIPIRNSDIVGRMIFNFWRQSVFQNPEGAAVIEAVARDIIKAANAARGKEWVEADHGTVM